MAEVSEIVTLTVGGQRHEGWTEVEIVRALDTMVGTFALTLTDRWADREESFPLKAGASCTVAVASETVITGWIDRLEPSIAGEAHSIRISGRDRAADLIDCSAVATPGTWRDTKLEAIAAELAKPFGISVTAKADTGPAIRRFALQQGETVQAALERLCRFAGLLAISTAEGQVELIVPGKGVSVERFEIGKSILSGSAAHDVSDRFSDYIIKGQASGDDHASGKTVAAPKSSAKDPGVQRYRPLLVIAEEQATLANLEKRARWEASTRAGRAQPVTITAPGWRRPDGKLRDRDTIVDLVAPPLFASGRMLVQSVTLRLGGDGTKSELTLVPPQAWSQLAIPESVQASRIGK